MRDQIIPGVIFVVALAIFLGGIVGVRFPLGDQSAGQVVPAVPAGSQTTTPSPSPTPTATVTPVPTVTPTATTPTGTPQQQPATRSNPYTPSPADYPLEEEPIQALW